MLSLLKTLAIILLLSAITLTGWAFGRNALEEKWRKSEPARYMDIGLTYALHYGKPVIDPFRKLLYPVLGQYYATDYTKDMKVLSYKQVDALLKYARNKRAVDILFYLYSPSCAACDVNLDEIDAISKRYEHKKLLVIALAIQTTPEALSEYYNKEGGVPAFKLFLLKAGEEALLQKLSTVGAVDYNGLPYAAIISQDGRVEKLPIGLGKGSMIQDKVAKTLDKPL